jgi:tRNA (cytidine/uridine-2'-O-)-methyltransferase
MQIALYQPDIPQNFGSILRLSACMGARCHVIEPCGFVLDDKRMKRVAMDYIALAEYMRHSSWEQFRLFAKEEGARICLLTTKATQSYYDFAYRKNDILLLGQESAGVPQSVADVVDAKLRIPVSPQARSLNIAVAAGMALGEAVRQTGPMF